MIKMALKKRFKKNIFEIIGTGFEHWWNNLNMMLPFLFFGIAAAIAVIILFAIFGMIFVSLFGVSFISDSLISEIMLKETNPEIYTEIISELSQLITPSIVLFLIFALIISFLAIYLIKAYFFSGAIGMAKEIIHGKKAKLKFMNQYGKKFMPRYWLIKFFIAIFIILWLFVFSLPAIISGKWILMFITFLSIIPLIFILLLFYMAEYYLVMNDLTAVESLRQSFNTVKANYFSLLGLIIIFSIINIILSFIPFIGGLLNLLVLIPVETIAFFVFAYERQNFR